MVTIYLSCHFFSFSLMYSSPSSNRIVPGLLLYSMIRSRLRITRPAGKEKSTSMPNPLRLRSSSTFKSLKARPSPRRSAMKSMDQVIFGASGCKTASKTDHPSRATIQFLGGSSWSVMRGNDWEDQARGLRDGESINGLARSLQLSRIEAIAPLVQAMAGLSQPFGHLCAYGYFFVVRRLRELAGSGVRGDWIERRAVSKIQDP
jgi:hypothetical protein